MPLLVRIYKLLINEMHGLIEERKEDQLAEEEYDEDGDYEDEEGDDEDESESAGADLDLKDEIEIDENGAADGDLNFLSKHDRKLLNHVLSNSLCFNQTQKFVLYQLFP